MFLSSLKRISTYQLQLNISDNNEGEILVNKIIPENYTWTGEYFDNISINLTAIPQQGYKFTGWSQDNSSTNATIEINTNIYTIKYYQQINI